MNTRLPHCKLFTCTSHPDLARDIGNCLNIEIAKAVINTFSNKETIIELQETVRGQNVFIVQTGCGHVNHYLMELLIFIHTCKIGSAERITAIIPCYPYARQDKRTDVGTPITAKLVANLLATAGANHIITMDLHAAQIEGFFDVPVDNLSPEPVFVKWIQENVPNYRNAIIVSPDAGGVRRATSLALKLKMDCALIHKERDKPNEVAKMRLIGEVNDKVCIILDDMADTCGTMCNAAAKLIQGGATKVYAMITHGIFSGRAIERLNSGECNFEAIITTNTLPQEENILRCGKIQCLDISMILAQTIARLQTGQNI